MQHASIKDAAIAALATLIAAFSEYMGPAPASIKVLASLMALLILVDTLSGAVAAGMAGRLKSHTLRTKAAKKIVMYCIVAFCAWAITIVLGSWPLLQLPLSIFCAAEVNSVLENVRRMEKSSGVRLPGLSKLTDKLAPYMDDDKEKEAAKP